MCPMRLTISLKIEDMDLPTDEATIVIGYPFAARYLLRELRAALGRARAETIRSQRWPTEPPNYLAKLVRLFIGEHKSELLRRNREKSRENWELVQRQYSRAESDIHDILDLVECSLTKMFLHRTDLDGPVEVEPQEYALIVTESVDEPDNKGEQERPVRAVTDVETLNKGND